MPRFVIKLLQVGIALALLVGLYIAVVVIPTTAADQVQQFPPYAPLRLPFTVTGVLALLSIMVALIAVWVLLSMVDRDAIFTTRAFFWVDVVIGCTAVATLLAVGVTVHLLVADIPTPDDGMEVIGATLTTGACAALGGSLVLLMIVMRQLLRKAVQLRAEMAEII